MSTLAARLSLLALVLASAEACGGDDAPHGDDPDVPGATLELDGLVLIRAPLQLLDPNTGKRSAPLPYATGLAGDRQFVVSPDGTRIAYFTTEQTSHHLVIASFGLDGDGTPVFIPSADAELPSFGPLSWPASGDRVVVGGAIIDPATGAITTCSGGTGNNVPENSVTLFPDGSYQCPRFDDYPATLELDGLVVTLGVAGADPTAGPNVTADAQVLGLSNAVHLPTGAKRVISISNTVAHESDPLNDYLYGGEIGRLAARDGSALGYQAAPDGMIVVDFGGGPTVRPTTTTLVDGHRLDVLSGFAAGAYELGASVPGATRLAGLLTDGTGRRFGPVMMTGDGRVIYAVVSHVIGNDPLNPLPFEAPVESALQEIRPDGTTRGFRTSTLALLAGEEPGSFARVDLNSGGLAFELDDGDWLYPGNIGYLGGEPVWLEDAGMATADGTWFLASHAPTTDAPGTLCVREIARAAKTRCMTVDGNPTVLDLVGDRGEGPPIMRATSRDAAWPGAPVVIYGARFGASPGTITVGDVTVPASAITSWTDHRIDFTMDASLPAIGQLRVTTAAGPSRGRAFWLGKTARIPTPFDDVPVRIPLGQGQNYIPPNVLPPGAAIGGNGPVQFVSSEDGTVVVWSEGGDDEPYMAPITIPPYTRQYNFLLEDRLADDARWQLVRKGTLAGPVADVRSNFDLIGGERIDHDTRRHPLFGNRILSDVVQPRSTTTLGLPDFWRAPLDDATTSWVVDFTGLGETTTASHLLGWTTSTGGRWGYRETASGVGVGGYYMTGVAATGDVVLVVGGGTFEGSADGVLRLSHDGGHTWSAQTRIAGTETGFVEPIAIHDDAGDYFLVFEAGWITSGWGGGSIRGVHRVDLDGTFTPDVTPVPAISTTSWISTGWHHPFDVVQSGSRLLVFAPASSTLVTIDLAAATPTWTTLPAAGDAGRVRNIFHDTSRGDVVILMQDGTAARATDAAGWTDVASYDFGFDVPYTRVLPLGLMRAPDGRWLVNAALYTIGSDDASPFGPNGWLLSPPP